MPLCYTSELMYTELFETLYPINTKKEKGVVVTAVDPFALGDELGIEPGDRIMKVNGRDDARLSRFSVLHRQRRTRPARSH